MSLRNFSKPWMGYCPTESTKIVEKKGAATRCFNFLIFIAFSLISYVFSTQKADADQPPPSPSVFIAYLESGLPHSGMLTVEQTTLNPASFPPSSTPDSTGPLIQKFYATWDGDNFLLKELTPEIASPTNSVTGMLLGQKDNLLWEAVGYQLNLLSKPNNSPDSNTDNNVLYTLVANGRSMVLSFLGLNYSDMIWSNNQLSAVLGGLPIKANIKFNDNILQVEGTMTGQQGVTGNFRIDYLEWTNANGFAFPDKYTLYTKFPGDSEYKQVTTWQILEIQVPSSVDSAMFGPDYSIDRSRFKTYEYVSNQAFFLKNTNLVPISRVPYPNTTVAEIAPRAFLVIVLIFTGLFMPLCIWIRSKGNKK